MVKRADLEPEIRRLWVQRPSERRTGNDVLMFYNELSHDRPDLLAFKVSGDKYQVLKSILYGLINE